MLVRRSGMHPVAHAGHKCIIILAANPLRRRKTMAGPCEGLVVLDFSWGMAGGLARGVLADFGADAIEIEAPSVDPFRSHPAWLAWNRGKKGAVLDLKTVEGRGQAQRLAEQADVVLEAFRPGVAQRLG